MFKEAQIEYFENDLWDYIKENVAPLISKLQSCSEEDLDEPHSAIQVPVVTSLDGFAKELLNSTCNMNIYQVVIIYVIVIAQHQYDIFVITQGLR